MPYYVHFKNTTYLKKTTCLFSIQKEDLALMFKHPPKHDQNRVTLPLLPPIPPCLCGVWNRGGISRAGLCCWSIPHQRPQVHLCLWRTLWCADYCQAAADVKVKPCLKSTERLLSWICCTPRWKAGVMPTPLQRCEWPHAVGTAAERQSNPLLCTPVKAHLLLSCPSAVLTCF